MADHGELPGVPNRFALFSDEVHPNRFSTYALNVMALSMLYNESPLNYPSDLYVVDAHGMRDPNGWYWSLTVPKDYATVVKNLVWDVLNAYPPARMKPRLFIANRRLEPVIAGQPCRVELKALHAKGPCAWTISTGILPQGFSFSAQGVLAGQSAAVGNYPVTVKLTDGTSSCERPLVLSISRDTPPRLPEQPLRTVSLDQYVVQPLKAEGGVGNTTWSVAKGKLPHGMMLTSAGMLVGSPGNQAISPSRSRWKIPFPKDRAAEKTLTWPIGYPPSDVLQARCLNYLGDERAPTSDGPHHGLRASRRQVGRIFLETRPRRRQAGQRDADREGFLRRRLDVVQAGRRAPRSPVLAVKVLDGPKGKTPKDGIHIFIDGNHNRSVVYSSDDTHLFVPRNHKGATPNNLAASTVFAMPACTRFPAATPC